MGLRATNPRPKNVQVAPPTMPVHHPRIPSPALSMSNTDSDDSMSLLSIGDLPPFSDKPTYYEQAAAPPRPPRNPERLREYVPFIHRRPEPAPSPYPPPSAPLPPLPATTTPPVHSLDQYPSPPAEQYHILTHPYSTQLLVDSHSPALNSRKELTPSPLSLYNRSPPPPPNQPLPSSPTNPVTSLPNTRLRSTTHPQPNPRPKVHFSHSPPDSLSHPLAHPHPNKSHTMYPTPGGLSPCNARPHPTESVGTMSERDRESRHRSSRFTISSISSSISVAAHLSQSSEDPNSNSHLVHRGPVGVPIRRAGPGALVSRSGSLSHINGKARTQALPISTSPHSAFTLTSDSDSDDAPAIRHHHTAPPSDAALVLNVHGGLDISSRRHHRFKWKEVPYPRSYEQGILDLDILDMLLTRQMSGGSLTWHVFPPSWNVPVQGVLKKVLDIGCGNGAWVIEAAKCWKGCEVVGLDVVSLHPNLARVSRDKDVARRVSWVQANFLEELPFCSDEFDFVHVKRIARGVPEDKWNHLFEEIIRVMKPGAAFEVVEEDLSFPGWPEHDGSEVGTLRSRRSNLSASHRDLYLSTQNHGVESGRSSAVESSSSTSDSAQSGIDVVPKTEQDSKPPIAIAIEPSSSSSSFVTVKHPSISISLPTDTPILTSSPTDMHRSLSLRQPSPTPKAVTSPKRPWTASSSPPFTSSTANTSTSPVSSAPNIPPPPTPKMGKAARETLREPITAPFFVPPASPSSKSMTINPPKVQKRGSANAAVLFEPTTPPFFVPRNRSKASLVEDKDKDKGKGKEKEKGKSRTSMFWSGRKMSDVQVQVQMQMPEENETEGAVVSGLNEAGPSSQGNGSMPPQPQANGAPRVNWYAPNANGSPPPHVNGNGLSPANGMPQAQVEVPQDPRDHSILERIYTEMHEERFINLSPLSLLADAVGMWFENVRTHPPIVFRFPPSRETPYDMRSPNIPGSSTSTKDRDTRNANPIISVDGLLNGASPYASLDASTQTQIRTRLPNPALDVDLRSLNLHLALRVKEIVACAEAMWEWVEEFQRKRTREEGVYARILELTRAQFDELVLRFELDMREHMGLGSVLEDRFNWTVIPGPTPQEKRFFGTACEKWDAYQRLVGGGACAVPHPATRLSRSLRVFVAWKSAVPHAQL
ncbi:hypothetical protein AZE42_03447 [Rhizopogon vesiculosus]|uniref:Methyltransferase domain-containing protein n=1 Tax=Rhizopogon vesiculosus TaxID=180088 RepID=A0A1J8PUC6_9AGAM|nr:hypothetical protein AZE42_03447 [Rhizopogon vesiculosus]